MWFSSYSFHWDSWVYKFIVYTRFGKCSVINSSNIFSDFCPSFLHLGYNYMYVGPPNITPEVTNVPFFIFFSTYFNLEIYIAMSSSSSSFLCNYNLLLIPSFLFLLSRLSLSPHPSICISILFKFFYLSFLFTSYSCFPLLLSIGHIFMIAILTCLSAML